MEARTNKEWFDRFPENYRLGMRKGFDDHIDSVYRSPMILPYMIAAPAEFSHHFILLVEHVASGNTRESYIIPNNNIRVSYFNQDVNLRDCLTWLTEELEDEDFETIYEDNLFQKHRSLLLKMARGGVNVYNKETWSTDDEYNDLLDMFHKQITPHSVQGQKIESHIQMFSLNSKNNKGEARRTWLGWIRSLVNRQFDPYAVRRKKATIVDEVKRKKVKRVRNADRVCYFTDFLNNYVFPLTSQALERLDTKQFNDLVDRLTDVGNKSSCDEYNEMVRRLHEGRRMKRRETSKEMSKLRIYVSALMGGTIKLQFLRKGVHDDALEEELEYRDADLDLPVCWMNINDAKKLLKKKEFDRLRDCGLEGRFEKWEEVNEFEPQCEEMRALIEDHVAWLTDKSAKKK